MKKLLCTVAVAALVSPVLLSAQSSATPAPSCTRYVAPVPRRPVADDGWCDPAPHRELGITVAPNVKLHVLDFGGTGTPLVFLTGIGNNAHVFDDFAQRFTSTHRVIAITRRGFGESSHPDGPYDQATLAADNRAVLDSLGIRKAIFAGHSIGGYEITHFAALYPDRVIGIIYLDAGSDPVAADSIRKLHTAELAALESLPHAPPAYQEMPTPLDSASAKAAWAYRQRTGLIDNTESAVRTSYFYEGFNPYRANNNPVPAKMEAAIRAGGRTPFAKVHAPALFIWAERDSVQHQPADVQAWVGNDPVKRAALEKQLSVTDAILQQQHRYILSELKGSRAVNIHGARHLIFLTHPDRVERAMKEFMAPLR